MSRRLPPAFAILALIIAPLGAQGPRAGASPQLTLASRSATLSCEGYDAMQQPPPPSLENFSFAYTSDFGTPFDTFANTIDGSMMPAPLPGVGIQRLRFWGISAEFDPTAGKTGDFVAECLEDNNAMTPFFVLFFSGDASGPDALVAPIQLVTPSSITNTGLCCYATDASVYEYDVELPQLVSTTPVRWILIARDVGLDAASGNSCDFLWVSENDVATYDNINFQHDNGDPGVDISEPGDDQMICAATGGIFIDGFESGDTSAWSSTVPAKM